MCRQVRCYGSSLRYFAVMGCWLMVGLMAVGQERTARPKIASSDSTATKTEEWKPLLPKQGLEGWEITNFGGEGSVDIKDSVLFLGRGDPLTGITRTTKDFPKENFEIRCEANRKEGSDFLVGLTFPVGDEFCSLICGGWGGGLVGLSSINNHDASENETASYQQFKNDRWYKIRVRVDRERIIAWIDDKEVVNVERKTRKFSLRAEVFKSKPLGYCVFQSIVEVRGLEYRVLDDK